MWIALFSIAAAAAVCLVIAALLIDVDRKETTHG